MKYFATLFCIFFSISASAMFCPKDLKLINLGDSVEDVINQCGKPDSQNTYKKTAFVPQEWDYYLKARSSDKVNSKLAVILKDNQILNITITTSSRKKLLCETAVLEKNQEAIQANCLDKSEEQLTVSSTTICGPTIRVGDTSESLQTACGKPDFISQSQTTGDSEAIEVTELKYSTMTGTVTLTFVDGKLAQSQ